MPMDRATSSPTHSGVGPVAAVVGPSLGPAHTGWVCDYLGYGWSPHQVPPMKGLRWGLWVEPWSGPDHTGLGAIASLWAGPKQARPTHWPELPWGWVGPVDAMSMGGPSALVAWQSPALGIPGDLTS